MNQEEKPALLEEEILESHPAKENIPANNLPERNNDVDELQKKIKHMEYNIEQNRNRAEQLSTNCNKLLRTTQLLAFDMIFANYLIGGVSPDQIYQFLENCLNPAFNLFFMQPENVQQIQEHINYLHQVINSCTAALQNFEFHGMDIERKTSEFLVYLKDKKYRLKHQLEKQSKTESKNTQEFTEDPITLEKEEIYCDQNMIEAQFMAWLTNEFHVQSDSLSSSIEFQCLLSNVSRKLASIAVLHDNIREAKEIISHEIDYKDCDPEALRNSPFFKAVKDQCEFLHHAFESLQSQQVTIPLCYSALENCRHHILEITESSKKWLSEIQRNSTRVQQETNRKTEDAEKLQNELTPFIDSLYHPPQFSLKNALEYYEELTNKLKEQRVKNVNNPEISRQIESEIRVLNDIKAIRTSIIRLCMEQAEYLASIAAEDQVILGMVMDRRKADEEKSLHDWEMDLISAYDDSMKDVIDPAKLAETEAWVDELGAHGARFAEIAKEQEKIVTQLHKLTHTKKIEADTKAKRKEIEELTTKNYKLNVEQGKLRSELDAALAEEIRARSEADARNEYLPPFVDRNDDQQVARYRAMYICPVCRQNTRDRIIITCGHPVCSKCIESSNGKCPICSQEYASSSVKPFFLQ